MRAQRGASLSSERRLLAGLEHDHIPGRVAKRAGVPFRSAVVRSAAASMDTSRHVVLIGRWLASANARNRANHSSLLAKLG